MFACVAAVVLLNVVHFSIATRGWATLVSIPEVQGGPTCCLFDSPFSATHSTNVVGYTSNSKSFVWSIGNICDFNNILNPPKADGLGPDPNADGFSHCGKWLNAVWADPEVEGLVHGYFHQEWQCNYADGGYTNKSIGYAASRDGGLTFIVDEYNNQIIAGSNFSTAHQTGEGDHGVVRIGDYLYLFFLEWDGYDGGLTVGLARSPVMQKGKPGAWTKWYNGSFSEPGVGGRADLIRTAGTAAAVIADVDLLVTIGVAFSPGPMMLTARTITLAHEAPVDSWACAPGGPLFTADASSWNRVPTSGELFAYPSLSGPLGNDSPIPSNQAYAYFTYLAPGATFADRYLIRRRAVFYQAIGNGSLPSLALLTLWCKGPAVGGCCTNASAWPTTGPVLGFGWSTSQGLYEPLREMALLFTSALPNRSSNRIVECQDAASGRIALAINACAILSQQGKGAVYLRTAGWAAVNFVDASEMDWTSSGALQPTEGVVLRADVVELWRCVGTGLFNYSAAVGADGASCLPYAPDQLLGFALSLLR